MGTIIFEQESFFRNSIYRNISHDFYANLIGIFGQLWIIVHGDGKEGTDQVAEQILNTIKNSFEKITQREFNPHYTIHQSLELAAQEMQKIGETTTWLANCSVSLALLLITQDQVFMANLGETKIYLLRDNELISLSSNLQVYSEEYRTDEHADLVISRALPSTARKIGLVFEKPEIKERIDLYENDLILLGTKGSYERLTRFSIYTAFENRRLVDGFNYLWGYATNKKSYEDFTMIALRITQGNVERPKKVTKVVSSSMKLPWVLIIFLVAIVLVVLTLLPYFPIININIG